MVEDKSLSMKIKNNHLPIVIICEDEYKGIDWGTFKNLRDFWKLHCVSQYRSFKSNLFKIPLSFLYSFLMCFEKFFKNEVSILLVVFRILLSVR